LTEMLRPFLFPRYNIGTTIELKLNYFRMISYE
jgi:hypothetical protein